MRNRLVEGFIGTFEVKRYYLNDLLHREDGPAIEFTGGSKYWYFHGKYIDCNSQEEFLAIINPKLAMFW
jgi:hypothetical protein